MTAHSVNTERGEVSILLDGTDYPMRPSYEAIVEIEKKSGMSLSALAWSVNDKTRLVPIRVLAMLVGEGIRAAGREREKTLLEYMSDDKIGRMIFEDYFGCLSSVSDFLANAMNGGLPVDKKKDPVMMTSE